MTDSLMDLVSQRSVTELGERVAAAVAAHGFSVLGVHDLGAKLREKGQDYAGECRVYEVCNAKQAARVLSARPDVSTALPCRISVYSGADGRSHVATILPSSLLGMFGAPALEEVGAEVEESLVDILRDSL